MNAQEINSDVAILASELRTLEESFDRSIREGKNFIEVKMIHLQIKELSKLIARLQNERIGKVSYTEPN